MIELKKVIKKLLIQATLISKGTKTKKNRMVNIIEKIEKRAMSRSESIVKKNFSDLCYLQRFHFQEEEYGQGVLIVALLQFTQKKIFCVYFYWSIDSYIFSDSRSIRSCRIFSIISERICTKIPEINAFQKNGNVI